jgi:hypothetical protein
MAIALERDVARFSSERQVDEQREADADCRSVPRNLSGCLRCWSGRRALLAPSVSETQTAWQRASRRSNSRLAAALARRVDTPAAPCLAPPVSPSSARAGVANSEAASQTRPVPGSRAQNAPMLRHGGRVHHEQPASFRGGGHVARISRPRGRSGRAAVAALDWRRDLRPGCVDAAALPPRSARAAASLGVRSARRGRGRSGASVSRDGAFVATIRLRTGTGQLVGTRELDSREHCPRRLIIGVAIALMVDVRRTSCPEPARHVVPHPVRRARDHGLPYSARRRSPRARGLLPADRRRAELEPADVLRPSSTSPGGQCGAAGSGRRARFRLATLGVRVSARRRKPGDQGVVCFGQEVGQLEASGPTATTSGTG